MTVERTAQCSCGSLRVRCLGEPVRRSICHCEACRRRTGSLFSFNLTFEDRQVEPTGEARTFTRRGESGRTCTYSFCPGCGATVFYTIEARPGKVSVPAGAFGLPSPFEPAVSVYGARREPWLAITPAIPLVEE